MTGGLACELPASNPEATVIAELLRLARIVGIVGLSPDPRRDSNAVARYLLRAGFRVVPINPKVQEALGLRAFPDLLSVPDEVTIDIVDVFRRPEFVPEIVDQALTRGVKAIWMQRGVVHNAAAERAREAGLTVVMDRCIGAEHASLARSA